MFLDKLIILFFIYSFCGYIAEVIYCSIGTRHLVNRGFLYGPWLPIYGFGGVSIYLLLSRLTSFGFFGGMMVFLLSAIVSSIIEYIGSWALEKIYSIKLWDYSKKLGNINGRVCLLNSTLFGLGGIAITYIINPPLERAIAMIPSCLYRYIAESIVVILSLDFILSSMKLRSVKRMLVTIKNFNEEIETRYNDLVSNGREEFAHEYKEKLLSDLDKLKLEAASMAKRMLKVFPTCTSHNRDIHEALQHMKKVVEKKINNLHNNGRSDLLS